jgi:hypothetical protein
MSEYIECRNCDSPYCNGCNVNTLSKMLHKGAFKRITDDHHSIIPVAEVVAVKHGRCKFCGGKDNAFHILNAETAAYSGIELAINRQGMLRVRVYDDYECETALPQSSEIVMIAACPNCGAKMDGE